MRLLELSILACSEEIEKAFKSLIQSGRPDILDEDNNSMIPTLYVDLFDNNYVLNQVLDDNHTLLKGRRGTGKSTIFLKAEHEIQRDPSKLAIYINLQTCYEEVKSSNSDANEQITKYLTYKNFLTEILVKIKEHIGKRVKDDEEFDNLYEKINQGEYIDQDFQRSLELTSTKSNETSINMDASIDVGKFNLSGQYSDKSKEEFEVSTQLNEIRIFSIHTILKQLKTILTRYQITKVFLFLDDFSELSYESQKVVVDSLVAPIISSYNDFFKVKIAAYPGRIYTGNIDVTKLPSYPLDFYDAFESSASNYNEIEDQAIDYIKRTIAKRLEIFTRDQIYIDEIFEISQENDLEEYLRLLFHCSAGIPRSLGFILNYCYLSSINAGRRISKANIDAASERYFINNILADFINDARFKQAFYDDRDLLDQIAQKNLMDKITEKMFNIKRDLLDQYQKGRLKKQIFVDTIEQFRKASNYWIPTSHFFMNKDSERLLKTLELYFIVTKFNEGSSREPGKKVSYFGLNYGLCLTRKIDYGRPSFRRTYDYWRQDEFDLNDFIPSVLSNIEVISCDNCGKDYDETEYTIYLNYKNCFKCMKSNTVTTKNKFQAKFKAKLEEWSEKKLPDTHIEILRTLYNNRDIKMSAVEIGTQIDRHHAAITQATRPLSREGYVLIEQKEKRYYQITDSAVSRFFSESIEELMID